MLKEILESFRVNWLSRLSSPLFAALALSWAIWNHRLIFTLFTNQTIQWRFAYIDHVLYPTAWHHFFYQLILPILTAAFYLFVFPIPARGVFRYTLRRKVELNDLAKQIEGKRLLTEDDAKELRDQNAQLEAERATQEEQLKKQISLYRDANGKLTEQISSVRRNLYLARAEALSVFPDQAKKRIEDFILSRSFMLIFNMDANREKGSKRMVFGEGGVISMGANDNEASWNVTNTGTLEFLNSERNLHSEFLFDPHKGNFVGNVPSQRRAQLLAPAQDTKLPFD